MEPVYGVSVGYAEQNSTPAIAASPEPMAKVREIVALTLTPMSCAASLSSDTASIACPAFVFLMNIISAIIITTHASTVTMVVPEMVNAPSASFKEGRDTTELNDFVSAPNSSNAAFCRK